MTDFASKVYKSISEALVDAGILTADKAEDVKLKLTQNGGSEEELLRSLNIASEVEFIKAKALYLRVPYIDLETIGFSPEALSLVPENVAQKYKLAPYSIDQKTKQISVAMANPLDLETVDFLEKKTGFRVKTGIAVEASILAYVSDKYGKEKGIASEVSKALDERKKDEEVRVDDSKKVSSEAPVAKIVSTVLDYAVKSRASDVHIEPQEDNVRIRYRVDGILQEKYLLPRNVHEAVVSRIKILSNLKIDEKRVPQDGRFFFASDGGDVDLRVSTLPTAYGEKVVMRLLKKSQKVPTLPELGLRGRALSNLMDGIKRPHGIIIVCGPTGSGKTTTLYSVLDIVATSRVNVVTVEDPIEYQMKGVNQVQVNVQAGLTFASALRSFLRQDPNIIMVGEIRDTETAELAINASLTGHLVFSTLHTNDASGVPPRMLDMGVEPFLLVSSLHGIVGQRVLRKVCPHCVTYTDITPDLEIEMHGALGPIYTTITDRLKKDGRILRIPHVVGCDKCNNTGYLGRVAIYEVMIVTERIAKMVLARVAASDIQKEAMEEGMLTMKQDGYVKVLEGITTTEEVLRVAQN